MQTEKNEEEGVHSEEAKNEQFMEEEQTTDLDPTSSTQEEIMDSEKSKEQENAANDLEKSSLSEEDTSLSASVDRSRRSSDVEKDLRVPIEDYMKHLDEDEHVSLIKKLESFIDGLEGNLSIGCKSVIFLLLHKVMKKRKYISSCVCLLLTYFSVKTKDILVLND